jgi:phage N-6-adenine-methyltransferase
MPASGEREMTRVLRGCGPRVMPAQRPGRSRQDYATPEAFILAVLKRFKIPRFDTDLAASNENAKADDYLSEDIDSLAQDWTNLAGVEHWLNPPFGYIDPWAAKCAEYARSRAYPKSRPGRLFFLTPASVGANWFAEHVWKKALVIALQGRLSFDGKAPYPKDCILSCYGMAPGFEVWDWRRE